MLTFLHGADFHLDSPFLSLSPEQATQRRREQRFLFTRMAELVRAEQVSLILLSGDLMDRNRVYPETLEMLLRTLGELDAEIVISPGNHDPYSLQSPYARLDWPSNVHIFTNSETERIDLPELGCAVYGSAFLSHYRMDSPLEGLSAPRDDLLHFGCFHGDLDGTGRYGPISHAQIAASKLDYLALGHVHTCSGLKRAGKTFYAYPGCPEGRGFDETGEKGVLLGRIGEDHFSLDFVPLCHRKYQIFPVDVTGKSPYDAVRAALPEDAQEDVVRIVLTGLRQPEEYIDWKRLEALVKPQFYNVSLIDQTALSQNIWARQKEDTLTGLFLRNMRVKLDAAPSEEKHRIEKAVRFGLAALEGREEPV